MSSRGPIRGIATNPKEARREARSRMSKFSFTLPNVFHVAQACQDNWAAMSAFAIASELDETVDCKYGPVGWLLEYDKERKPPLAFRGSRQKWVAMLRLIGDREAPRLGELRALEGGLIRHSDSNDEIRVHTIEPDLSRHTIDRWATVVQLDEGRLIECPSIMGTVRKDHYLYFRSGDGAIAFIAEWSHESGTVTAFGQLDGAFEALRTDE